MQFGREWTKFAVRFREVSGLESVRLERVDCITYCKVMQQSGALAFERMRTLYTKLVRNLRTKI